MSAANTVFNWATSVHARRQHRDSKAYYEADLANQQRQLQIAQAQLYQMSMTEGQKVEAQRAAWVEQQQAEAHRRQFEAQVAAVRAAQEARTQARIDTCKSVVQAVRRKARGRV